MLSIIIPVRNEESVIEKTLKKLREIKTIPYEIIISDGNSTDRTAEICRRYADEVILAQGKQSTIAAGKNVGAMHARGEFLLFIDADIIIPEPDALLGRALAQMEKDSRLSGITVSLRVFKEMETFLDWLIFGIVNWVHFIRNNIIHNASASGEFQLIRTESFKKVGGYDEHLAVGEDNVMFWRLAHIGKTLMMKELTVYHTGRRAHAIGWPKLLYQWLLNVYFIAFKEKAAMDEWEPIR